MLYTVVCSTVIKMAMYVSPEQLFQADNFKTYVQGSIPRIRSVNLSWSANPYPPFPSQDAFELRRALIRAHRVQNF